VASSSTGNTATALGAIASAGYTNSTAIGYQATTTADNTIQLGNSSVTTVNTSGTVNAKSYYWNGISTITAGSITTIDLSTNNIFKVNLGQTIETLNLTNARPGTYIIEFVQNGQGNSRIVFPTTNWKWAGRVTPEITTIANAIDIVTIVYDGTTFFASAVQNF
jgi:hypothetical protein